MQRVDDLHLNAADGRIALVERDRELSFAALEPEVARVAGSLRAEGVEPGDRVAIWLGKKLEWVIACLATMRAGGIAIPVNPVLKPAQVGHILQDSGAKLLLTNHGRADADAFTGTRMLTLEADWQRLAAGPPIAPGAIATSELAAILYTSGSTGRPKGVMLSHANLVLGARSVIDYIGIGPDDRILCALPFSFDYGLNQLLTCLATGATAVLFDYLLPRDVPRAIARHAVTGLAGVPPLWMQLVDAEWPDDACRLRYITNSGGRMPVALTRRLRALLPDTKIYLMYGLTEAFRSTYLDPALVDSHPESIGGAIPNAEVHVLRPDGSEAADGEPGELVHSGPLVAKGYWNDPERTALRFRPAPGASNFGGTSVWSGDTVVRRDGLLYFVGRDDEMIKTSGNRVSPTEIEEAAFNSGAIGAAVAFGIDDPALGQAIVLVATPAPGLASAASEAMLRSALARELPAFMQPRRIVWRETLPRNPNGKIDRAMVRQGFRP
jgi:acyl-CoA ligase (AMP-forming) (exosortase A-associated)